MKTQRIIQTGEQVETKLNGSLTVDKILSEVSELYLKRFKAYRSGDREAFEKANQEIASLKAELNKF